MMIMHDNVHIHFIMNIIVTPNITSVVAYEIAISGRLWRKKINSAKWIFMFVKTQISLKSPLDVYLMNFSAKVF